MLFSLILSTHALFANFDTHGRTDDPNVHSPISVCGQGAREQANAYIHSHELPGQNCSSITWLSKKEEPHFCYHVMIRCELEKPLRIDHDFSVCYFWQQDQGSCLENHFEYQGEFRYSPPEEEDEDPHSPD